MLNAKAFANAASLVMAVWVVGCALLTYVMPDLLLSISQSWTHTINLGAVRAPFNPGLGSLILGFVSAVGLTWVTTYGTVALYNKFAKKG